MYDLIEHFYIGDEIGKERIPVLLEYVKKLSVEEILEDMEGVEEKIEAITPANISQFSDIEVVDYVVQIVADSTEEISYQYVGYMLNKAASRGAQTKYGENHLKMAIQMGLISQRPFKVTELGKAYLEMEETERKLLKPKLYLRVPIVTKILIESKSNRVDAMMELRKVLSESTAVRRRSNIKTLIEEISKIASLNTQKQIMDNIYWG